MNRPTRSKNWLLSKKLGWGGTPFAERIHKIVLDDVPYLDFFISDLIKLVWIKIPSKTEKSRADVCLRAHVDDEDPLTRVGLRIVGGEVVGQRRLSDTTLGRIFLLHTWWQHCDWALQGIAKSVHCNSMSVISFLSDPGPIIVYPCQWLTD